MGVNYLVKYVKKGKNKLEKRKGAHQKANKYNSVKSLFKVLIGGLIQIKCQGVFSDFDYQYT